MSDDPASKTKKIESELDGTRQFSIVLVMIMIINSSVLTGWNIDETTRYAACIEKQLHFQSNQRYGWSHPTYRWIRYAVRGRRFRQRAESGSDLVMIETPMQKDNFARQIAMARRARLSFLPSELLGEPVWDMLIDLFIAESEGRPVTVSSVCMASGAPTTTALRWLARMEDMGLIRRTGDRNDRRRIHVCISPETKQAMERWLSGIDLH